MSEARAWRHRWLIIGRIPLLRCKQSSGRRAIQATPGPIARPGLTIPSNLPRSSMPSNPSSPAPIAGSSPEPPEPYSLQWFLDIENQRHSKHGKWIPKLLEFAKHPGEKLLGVGHGLGTDWAQYAQNGATVTVCSPADAQLELVRTNFRPAKSRPADSSRPSPTCLPWRPAASTLSASAACITASNEPEKVIEEVYRVLKPGRQGARGHAGLLRRRFLGPHAVLLASLAEGPPRQESAPLQTPADRLAGRPALRTASATSASANGNCAGRKCRTFGAGFRCRSWLA